MVGAERFQIIWVIGVRPNYMGDWFFSAWKGKKEYYLPKKERSFIKYSQKKALSLANRSENGHFCLHATIKSRMFPSNIGKKNGTVINSPIVASVGVTTSLGKHVFSEEFIQGNNAIG